MKNILFCLGFILVILLPTSFCARGAKPAPGFKMTQQKYAFVHCQPENEDLFFDDYLEDDSDDIINKTIYNSSSDIQNFSACYFKRTLSSKFLFHHQDSLYLFISVLRI